jgi:hypothetical protein
MWFPMNWVIVGLSCHFPGIPVSVSSSALKRDLLDPPPRATGTVLDDPPFCMPYIFFSCFPFHLLLGIFLTRHCRRFLRTTIVPARPADTTHIPPLAEHRLILALDRRRCTHHLLHRRQQDRRTQLKGPRKVPLSKRSRRTRTLRLSRHKSPNLALLHQLQISMIPALGHQVK